MPGDAPWFRTGLAIKANIYRDARNDDLVFDFAPVASGYGWIFPKRDHVNIDLYRIDPSKHLSRDRLADYIVHRFGIMQSRTTLSTSISVEEFMAQSPAVRRQRLPFVQIMIEM